MNRIVMEIMEILRGVFKVQLPLQAVLCFAFSIVDLIRHQGVQELSGCCYVVMDKQTSIQTDLPWR